MNSGASPDARYLVPMAHKLVPMLLCALTLAGCAPKAGYVSPHMGDLRLERGLVIVLPGIEGRSSFNEAICEGLADGGVRYAIDLIDWTSSVRMNYLGNLRNQARNRKRAEDIAHHIMRYKLTYPGRPVLLVGQSGGGGMAAWIVEALPRGQDIDGIIMLAPALSPSYPLADALARCKRGIVSFHSSRDWFMLGVGTTISGTMDGEHTSSAGRIGFEAPPGPGAELYRDKLLQVPWQAAMSDAGYTGTHLTSGARSFVAAFVAPLVLADKWDAKLIEVILSKNGYVPTSAPSTRPATQPAAPPADDSQPPAEKH